MPGAKGDGIGYILGPFVKEGWHNGNGKGPDSLCNSISIMKDSVDPIVLIR